jgi:hypothetical protein
VSEHLPDSPIVARAWCPGCEPFADPTLQILDLRYCEQHAPGREGSDDLNVTLDGHLSGSAEAGGDANRLWCQLLHRETNRMGGPDMAPQPPRRSSRPG